MVQYEGKVNSQTGRENVRRRQRHRENVVSGTWCQCPRRPAGELFPFLLTQFDEQSSTAAVYGVALYDAANCRSFQFDARREDTSKFSHHRSTKQITSNFTGRLKRLN